MFEAFEESKLLRLVSGLLHRLAGLGCLFFVFWAVAAGAENGLVRKTIRQYALTSANDFPQRDPQSWRLLGSNDGGKTWVTLDVRTNEVFTERQQRKLYQINNAAAFETYRLQIDRVREPAAVTSVQLAEIELLGGKDDDLDPVPAFTDIIAAQGDNPPAETVANLFDGRVETKWLDWPTNSATRASWVQWQYTIPAEALVTNIAQLLALRARAGDGFQVRIPATVVGQISEGNRLCLVDQTGCIELAGIDENPALREGQHVSISGISDWADKHVCLKEGHAKLLGAFTNLVPEEILLEQPLAPGDDMRWVRVEGQIQYRRSGENECAFDLQSGALSMRVHVRCPDNSRSLPPSGTHVSIQGICQGAYNEQGRWVGANLWAAGWGSMTILDPQTTDDSPTALPVPVNQPPISQNTLTTIEQVRRLTAQQIRSRPRVKIRGVVTGQLGNFIQDDTAGIEVAFPHQEGRKITELGAYVEVNGVATLGEMGTRMISANRITVLGKGKLPQPQRLSLTQLTSGRMDAQWVEVEGVVRSTDGAHLLIICYGRELMATVASAPAHAVEKLVDAEVRARGVGVTAMDDQGRIQGTHLLIPSLEHLEVLVPPTDPASLPIRPIGSLLGLSGPADSFHRVKVEGVVTLQDSQRIFLQDDTGSAMAIFKENVVLDANFGRSRWLYWRTRQPMGNPSSVTNLLLGERVQVIGFPESRRYSPVLTEVVVRKMGQRESVSPTPATFNGMEESGLDSSLITIEGILRGQNTIGANIVLALEWKDRVFQVIVPGTAGEVLKIQDGSRVQVTGVCQVDPTPYSALGLGVGAVRILTRSSADLVVLAQPSWWTLRRALMLMGGMALVILIALVWIRVLRRQVGERTAQLTEEIHLREQTERRHALDQERTRIAKDLHDDLGANLTRIVFLSQRVEAARHDGQEVKPWFDLIPDTARRTIQSLDEIVWAVNPRHDSLESLANYLSQFAQEFLTLAGLRCVLDVPLVLPTVPLSAEVRHNVLLTTREALQNAVAHAAATEVRLSLKLEAEGLKIAVADDGRGFDPAAVPGEGNGLTNMRRRLEDIGGRLEITSRPGQGTVVRLFVPQSVLHGRVIGGNGSPANHHENGQPQA